MLTFAATLLAVRTCPGRPSKSTEPALATSRRIARYKVMRIPAPALIVPILALALGGCAAGTVVSPVEVTRFVGEQPARLGQGTIAVRAAPAGPGAASEASLEFSAYRQAVETELAQLGYTIAPGSGASQVAEIRFGSMAQQQQAGGRSPVNVGVGGSTGSFGSGVGLGVGIDLSGPPPEMIDTQMGVIIRDNGSGDALWEGRAAFSASTNSEFADRPAAAARLAEALFSGFPGQSGETIEVK